MSDGRIRRVAHFVQLPEARAVFEFALTVALVDLLGDDAEVSEYCAVCCTGSSKRYLDCCLSSGLGAPRAGMNSVGQVRRALRIEVCLGTSKAPQFQPGAPSIGFTRKR